MTAAAPSYSESDEQAILDAMARWVETEAPYANSLPGAGACSRMSIESNGDFVSWQNRRQSLR